MKIKSSVLSLSLAAAVLFSIGACTTVVQAPPLAGIPAKVSATGHGSMGSYGQYNATQQKLMAARAAKLDAYRNLAEQVYGFQITGNTTVNAFATQSDSVRAYVEAFMRGAKVVSMTPGNDGIYEATVELEMSAGFGECVVHGRCQPLPPRALQCAEPSCAPYLATCAGAGCTPPSGSGLAWPSP